MAGKDDMMTEEIRITSSKHCLNYLAFDEYNFIQTGSLHMCYFLACLRLATNRITYIDPRLAFATEDNGIRTKEVKRRFDGSTRALQVLQGLDLSGKHVVITGANTGIGTIGIYSCFSNVCH